MASSMHFAGFSQDIHADGSNSKCREKTEGCGKEKHQLEKARGRVHGEERSTLGC